ncbi:response regulator receiver protein [Thermobaculum terrenum ATCC BAA-798]|uniref:Response regulator receiver protein n=1 Tax=Thermobaculum terrenum (strain ATCC BAA-798 / CCMEE 7001 / YNP1) TaxID=525904 RepID=D1CIF5_THET1|nr:response regulator [Thermobaculum terrenum]ACZ43526.1 response regulator receiver protein [Thermobaculum terrenum ATCC BAA-798]
MHRGKIFVVDDLEDFRQLLEDVLSEQGYEVLSFERAADALAALQAQAPDLLITDIRLGNENGLGLVRTIRANAETRQLPVIICTAAILDLEEVEPIADPCLHVLPKPFEIADLVRDVSDLLARGCK